MDILTKLEALKKPMAYKWRIQSHSKFRAECSCVAYVDSRDVQDRLDEVFPGLWQDKYQEIKGNIYCSIGIFIGDGWVWRSDCGVESNVEKQKGEASDAFKRAAVKWGVGRFLYDLPIMNIGTKEHKGRPQPVNNAGQIIWGRDELTNYITALLNGQAPKPQIQEKQPKPKQPAKPKVASDAQSKLILKLVNEKAIPETHKANLGNFTEKLIQGKASSDGADKWIKYLSGLEKNNPE